MNLFLDFETASDIDIGKCGSFRYIEDDSFRVLLLAWAVNDEPVQLVDFTAGETWPEEFLSLLWDPKVTKIAHNAIFEREVIHKTLHYTPPEEWLDTMHLAAQCGLPLSLDAVGKALLLPEDQAKMKEGKTLIRYFCVPTRKRDGTLKYRYPEDAPTIDAVPVVHGRWEKSQYNGYLVCSSCRDVYVGNDWVDGKKWNYCPNCGARMDKDGKE